MLLDHESIVSPSAMPCRCPLGDTASAASGPSTAAAPGSYGSAPATPTAKAEVRRQLVDYFSGVEQKDEEAKALRAESAARAKGQRQGPTGRRSKRYDCPRVPTSVSVEVQVPGMSILQDLLQVRVLTLCHRRDEKPGRSTSLSS